jgi:hypothetical protein
MVLGTVGLRRKARLGRAARRQKSSMGRGNSESSYCHGGQMGVGCNASPPPKSGFSNVYR